MKTLVCFVIALFGLLLVSDPADARGILFRNRGRAVSVNVNRTRVFVGGGAVAVNRGRFFAPRVFAPRFRAITHVNAFAAPAYGFNRVRFRNFNVGYAGLYHNQFAAVRFRNIGYASYAGYAAPASYYSEPAPVASYYSSYVAPPAVPAPCPPEVPSCPAPAPVPAPAPAPAPCAPAYIPPAYGCCGGTPSGYSYAPGYSYGGYGGGGYGGYNGYGRGYRSY